MFFFHAISVIGQAVEAWEIPRKVRLFLSPWRGLISPMPSLFVFSTNSYGCCSSNIHRLLVQSGYLFWFSLEFCFGSAWIFVFGAAWIFVLVQPGYLFWFNLDICFGSAWIFFGFSLEFCFGSTWIFVFGTAWIFILVQPGYFFVQSGYLFWFNLDICFGSTWIFVLVQPGYLFWFSLGICFGSAWTFVLVQPGYLYRRHLSKYPWTFALLAYQNVIHITCLAPAIRSESLILSAGKTPPSFTNFLT